MIIAATHKKRRDDCRAHQLINRKRRRAGIPAHPAPDHNRDWTSIMAYRTLTAAALLVALAAPAMAADEIRPDGPPLVIQAGQGTAIQTPVPLGNVFIAGPDIANVQVPENTRNLIYVFAKAPGRTTLYALGDSGEVVLSRAVDVVGPKTVRVLRGVLKPEIWSVAHGEPTGSGQNISDLPPGSSVTIPVGAK
jgi:Pilus formation protein N terminal region